MTFIWTALRSLCAVWLSLLMCVPGVVGAQVAVPALRGHITDQTATLTPDEMASLEQQLAEFERRKGSQLAVLMVATTAPEDIAQFSLRVVDQWKLGRKKVDDGVLLLVAKNDRTLRIEVGYGLEGALSDVVSKRIISEVITPHFKQGDFYGGIAAGVAQIMRVVEGEPLPEPPRYQGDDYRSFRQFAPFLFIVAVALGGWLRHAFGQLTGSLITGVVVGLLAWWVIGALFFAVLSGISAAFVTLLGLGHRPGMGGYSGRGRGGFGGGGGGGFGGGGASGRW